MLIQAFLSKPTVEALNEGIVRRFSGSGEIQLHAPGVCPEIKLLGNKLRSIIHPNTSRFAISQHRQVQRVNYVTGGVAKTHANGWTDSGVVIDNGQATQFLSVVQLVRDKIHAPALILLLRWLSNLS